MKAWVLGLHNNVNQRRGVAAWTPEQCTAAYGSGGKDAALAALAAAETAGVGRWVVEAGREVVDRGMM